MRHRVFRPQIDESLGRPNRQPGNGHAFDQHVRVTFHGEPVCEGAGITLIGVADDVFLLLPGLIVYGLPLDTGGKGCATPTTEAGDFDLVDNALGLHADRRFQAVKAAMITIVGNRQRIGDANTGKSQALLAFQVGNIGHRAKKQRMAGRTIEQPGLHQPLNVIRFHRAIADPAAGRLDFHHWFKPEQPSGTVTNQFNSHTLNSGMVFYQSRHVIRPHGQGGGIAGHVDSGCHHRCSRDYRMSSADVVSLSARRSNFCGVMRPWISSFTRMEGAQAQLPRQ